MIWDYNNSTVKIKTRIWDKDKIDIYYNEYYCYNRYYIDDDKDYNNNNNLNDDKENIKVKVIIRINVIIRVKTKSKTKIHK